MNRNTMMRAGIAAATLIAAAPALASPIIFQLSGGKTATFTIDSLTVPDSTLPSTLIGDQISYNAVAGTFGGTAGTGTIGFGTGLTAALNIGGTSLGFTQYAGPALFSLVNNKPVFNFGTFTLSSITSGPATITISAGAVPETATWAMLLVGFGGIGATMRYRRRATKLAYA